MRIDSHVHIGNLWAPKMDEAVLESMDRYGIDISIVSNADCLEYDTSLNPIPEEKSVPQAVALKEVVELCRNNPGRIYGAFWCKPMTEELTDELVEYCAKNRDVILALKIHPYHSNLSIEDEKLVPYLELARANNWPVIVHTASDEKSHVQTVYRTALKYPDLKFVMAHMGLGTDNKEAMDCMEKAPNLYADTTWVPIETTKEIIRRFGSKRIVFGSDNPIDGVDTYDHNPHGDPSVYREYFGSLKEQISKEAYTNLMEHSARDLFGL